MGKILKFVVGMKRGMGQATVIAPDRDYVFPQSNGFKTDNANLNHDAEMVGKDLKKKIKQYANGQPSYQR